MSGSQPSQALTSRNNGSTGFAQQGSLDWVGLGQMQYNATLAVLARLAKAGVESLTVFSGQIICKEIPIGTHGEKLLTNAMGAMTAQSRTAEVLWFGVGVRHVLRDLVQTSEGCSLVALCAALTEAHSISVAALVLYEISKECGAPKSLTPSYAQWQSLVRVTAPVFNATTFGVRVNQILKMATNLSKEVSPYNCHPIDLARVLLDIGRVVNGKLAAVTVHGGCHCAFVAVWADYVLGLQTNVLDVNGDLVYDSCRSSSAQVTVHFIRDNGGSNSGLVRAGRTHILGSGTAFILDAFHLKRDEDELPNRPELLFSAGRQRWDNMLQNTFGNSILRLTGQNPDISAISTTPTGSPPRSLRNSQCDITTANILNTETDQVCKVFSKIMAVSAFIFVLKEVTKADMSGAKGYIHRACDKVPELRGCREHLLQAIENVRREMKTVTLQHLYYTARLELGKLCGCNTCLSRGTIEGYCLVLLGETVLYITFLLDRLIMDTHLLPTTSGLLFMYHDFHQSDLARVNIERLTLQGLYERLSRTIGGSPRTIEFNTYAQMFGAQSIWGTPHDCVAQSDGKIYCHINTLEHLTDCLSEASLVHVGSGSIEFEETLYYNIFDGHPASQDWLPPASNIAELQDFDCLNDDSTTRPLTSKVVIEEKMNHLYFWHKVTAGATSGLVAPSKVLSCLNESLNYLFQSPSNINESEQGSFQLQKENYRIVHGEGSATPHDYHVIRPLRNNRLGRCMLMSFTTGPVALIRNQEELECFAKFWAQLRNTRVSGEKPAKYYTLIT